ncbi:MAG TPA: hypothetical protein VGE85_10665 [Terracidiphilus sp.]|jgi:hypothetical protein
MKKIGFIAFVALLVLALASVVCYAQTNVGKTPAAPPAKLTAADIQFLTNQCKIGQPDIDVIPKLSANTQQDLLSRIAQRDCALLQPFIASRNYYRQLKPNTEIPLAPVGWGLPYLTADEYQRYLKILDSAPW